MIEAAGNLNLSDRSVAVALIVLTRYMASRDPALPSFIADALQHAKTANLTEADLSALSLMAGSIGR